MANPTAPELGAAQEPSAASRKALVLLGTSLGSVALVSWAWVDYLGSSWAVPEAILFFGGPLAGLASVVGFVVSLVLRRGTRTNPRPWFLHISLWTALILVFVVDTFVALYLGVASAVG